MTKTKARTGDLNGFRLGYLNLELGMYLGFGICDLELFLPWAVCLAPYAVF
jgi:hypothetical protein